jgi:hypothetical protein
MIELTAVGRGQQIGVSGHDGLVTRVVAASDRLGLMLTRQAPPVGGDHTSFGSAGMPAIVISAGATGCSRIGPSSSRLRRCGRLATSACE